MYENEIRPVDLKEKMCINTFVQENSKNNPSEKKKIKAQTCTFISTHPNTKRRFTKAFGLFGNLTAN